MRLSVGSVWIFEVRSLALHALATQVGKSVGPNHPYFRPSTLPGQANEDVSSGGLCAISHFRASSLRLKHHLIASFLVVARALLLTLYHV
jgi:hypothetical protein